ncbi:hypothetical protein QAD02_005687 [Eretmocerus hayati]|uniref:Uncharacterized protein n=1 Tax=Eretmocerus hayati TaxID=131215 RepID=A0ACC2NT39_9HYME|nr:hypothetical protein QAD02_005687 [Eretmocerus hayati]
MSPKSSLISDCKVITSVVPWQLKNWDITKRRRDIIAFENISLTAHSCKFNLSLCLDAEHDNIKQDEISTLNVKLHHSNGLRSKFFVTVYLEKKINKFSYACVMQPADLVTNEFIEIKKIVDGTVEPEEKNILDLSLLSEYYKNQTLVDVTIIVGPKKQHLYAHAVVLAIACPYFSSMLNGSNMKEQNTHIIDLSADPDITYDLFKGFLDYVYGIRKLEEMSTLTRELFILADKYNFVRLRHECDKMLCASLSKDNLTSLLIFAHQYNFELLEKKALDLARNCGMLWKDAEGLDQLLSNPKLAVELLQNLP